MAETTREKMRRLLGGMPDERITLSAGEARGLVDLLDECERVLAGIYEVKGFTPGYFTATYSLLARLRGES